jgi:hypothetical protein
MAYLVDANVLSELRKGQRCQRNVAERFARVDDEDLLGCLLVRWTLAPLALAATSRLSG